MWRILLAGLVFSFSLSALADEPHDLAKKPPYERRLKGEDAKRAEELTKRIAEREAADDYAEGIKAAEELVKLRETLQGSDHYEMANDKQLLIVLQKVAALDVQERESWRMTMDKKREAQQLEARAKYAEAAPLLRKALDIHRRVLGEEHRSTASSYNNLAQNLHSQGKFAEATPLSQKALDICRRVLGEEHPDTATSYNNVAQKLNAQGKHAEAALLIQKALDIHRRVLGEFHPITAVSYNNLAMNLQAQGRIAEATPLLQRALDTWRRVLGEEHPNTAAGYNSVAANLKAQGKFAEAAPLYQKALDIRLRLFGEGHPNTAESYNNVALNLNAQGRFSEAAPLFIKALDIRLRLLGEEHPDTAASYNNVANNMNAQGKAAEATPLVKRALEIRRRVLGEEHRDTAQSYNNLAVNLMEQEKFADAATFYQKALDIRRRVLGEEHRDTAQSYNNQAVNLSEQGNFAEAAPFFQKALDIRRHALGEEHPDTAASYNNVAMNLNAQGKAAEATPLIQMALDIRRRVLGEVHPKVAESYNSMAINLKGQGKNLEALPWLEKGVAAYEAGRLSGAEGLDRAVLGRFNPRLLLASIRQLREPMTAWNEVERSLARGLLDQSSHSSANLTPAEQEVWTREQKRLASVQPQILNLAIQANRSDEETARVSALLEERRKAEERVTALVVAASMRGVASGDTIIAALPEDAAILMWIDLASEGGDLQEHFACVVRAKGEPRWERLPGTGQEGKWTKEDSKLPDRFRAALQGVVSREVLKSLARQLHTQRLTPALKHLAGVNTLYVVPANEMAGVPVEALTNEFTVSYVPSGTFLARAKEKAPAAGTEMLAVGDPVFSSSRLPGGNGQGSPSEKPAGGETSNQSRPAGGTYLPSNGLLITQVAPGGAAAKGRLQAGDVIVKYGETEITSMKALDKAMEKAASAKEVPLLVWRESEKAPITRTVAPGKLGVALAKEPAREAIANRRKTDAMLLSLRGGGWEELPGTRVELTQIGKLFGERTTTLVDSAASEESLEALRKKGDLTRFRYIHFATHGEGNQVKAFESALILSQDGLPEDPLPRPGEPFINGQLSAREVLDYWKLDAELVTLSACETAVGKAGGGDGLLGFAQAFLTAGARSVCLSLWKVDDTATALLMQRFYQNLLGKRPGLDKPLGKAAALDEAKRWLRELSSEEALKLSAAMSGGVTRGTRGKGEDLKLVLPAADPKDPATDKKKPFADPRYWAAFILIGDPN